MRLQKELLAQIDSLKTIDEKLNILKPELNYGLNDRDYSKLFSEVVHSNMLYNISECRWMYYNGKYWTCDEGGVYSKRAMKEFSRALSNYVENLDPITFKDMISFVSDLGKAARRTAILKDAYDEYVVKAEDFDNNPYLFNCENGTIDLLDGNFHPHTPMDMLTKYSPVHYDTNVSSQRLDSFIDEIFCSDKDLIDYMYRVLGYSLTGLTKEECFFILYGESTRNGKSTLISMFSHLLGGNGDTGYMRDIDIETLAQKKFMNGSAPSPDVAKLKGARFIACGEPPEDFIMDEAKLKSMTGGDQITARLLYRNNISFMPSFKLFMATNHRPYIQDDSVLQSHRIRVIPFNRHFSAEEQDRTLKDALKDPKVQSALLNRCIYGFVQYLEKGLNEPKSVIDATSAYKSATEILELFLQDNFISSVDGLIALSSFYEQYTDWCEERNIIPLPKRKISVSLRTKGILRSSATINGKTVRNVVKGYCSKAVVSTVKKNNSVSDTSTETLAKPHAIPVPDLHLRHNGSSIPHKPHEAVLIKNNTATSNDDDDPIFDANGNLMDPITPKEG